VTPHSSRTSSRRGLYLALTLTLTIITITGAAVAGLLSLDLLVYRCLHGSTPGYLASDLCLHGSTPGYLASDLCLHGSTPGYLGRQIAAFTALHLATWRQIFSSSLTSMHVVDCALGVHQPSLLHTLCMLRPSVTVEQSAGVSSGITTTATGLKTELLVESYQLF